MNIQKILLSFIVTLLGLFFILNITYFDTNKTSSDFSIWDKYIWIKEIIKSWSLLDFKENISNLEDDKFYTDNINYVDRVYFNWKNYKKTQNDRDVKFELWKWLYLFDLYDLSYNYSINDGWFLLKPKSPWKFFIDNRNTSDIKIFSFDSIVDIELQSSWKEKMTSLVIYPHMFFWFNSSRNKFLKNADILRIESISRIFYVNESFLDNEKLLNQKFFSKIYPAKDDLALDFFKKFFYLSYSETEFLKYDIWNITFYKSKNILWLPYIEKYFLFFLNKEKKLSYYKKNILTNLNFFFEKKLSDKELESVKKEVIWDLSKLKEINPEDYLKFRDVISYYYKNLLKINSIDYIKNVLTLSDIIVSVDNSKTNYKLAISSFYLNKIYTLIDNKTYSSNYLQQNLLTFLNYFLIENEIKVKDWELLIEDNKDVIIKLDFLSYFLKNILIYNINFSKENFDNVLNIVEIYLSTNKNILTYYKNNWRYETLIVEYNLILNKFLTEIRNSFFEQDLNNRWLLILNTNTAINNNQVVKLNKIVNSIFEFHNKNKAVLSIKNENYNDLYSQNKLDYQEYYSALNNYPEYLIKYDKVKSDLLDAKTIFEWNEIKLSKENLIDFLSQFEWLDFSNLTYSIFKDKYAITNLYINWETFSFDLYPFDFNRMDNIYRNGQKLNLSYELDTLKSDLKELYDKVDNTQKDKYDFKKFFINTFFASSESTWKTFDINEETVSEDKTITFFKRDKLLWDKWEFNVLKWYLDIKYNDIIVTLNSENKYDIYIQKWVLKTSLNVNWSLHNIVAYIKADYVFSNTEHYFKNILITFYDKNYYENGEEIPMFSWKEFRVIKKLDILKFKDEMNNEIQKILSTN